MGTVPVNSRLLPAFLIFVCLVPLTLGTYQAISILITGPYALTFAPDTVDRLPLVVHIVGSVGFMALGAVQILPGVRHGNPGRHRRIGRWAAALGLTGAGAGLWMTLVHQDISNGLLFWGRLAASTFWMIAICLGVRAVLRRNIASHGAWMIRAYAMAVPAGTLAFVLIPLFLILGEAGNELLFEAVQVLAWPVHLGIAEWLVRRAARRQAPIVRLPSPALRPVGGR